ncbi:MAG: hypothetical protein QM647_15155 [Asticcacaulis sp.]|uniref:hypothetical protein n=1 Tax=Asticcacaulis sp. TaxID=1872648 RepID=UPI0039E654AA
MASKKRNRKARTTIPTPAEMRAIREAQEQARKDRELMKTAEGKKVENWGPNMEGGLYDYKRHVGTQMTRDDRGKPRGIWRTNPFVALATRDTITQDEGNAGMDYLRFHASSKGLEGPPEPAGAPDHTKEWGKEDRKRYYIRLCAAVLALMTMRSRQLISAFAFALIEEDRPLEWRGIIEHELGEKDPAKQVTRFQVMCEELIEVIPKARKELRDFYDRAA